MGFLARVGRRQLRRGSALCSYRTNVKLGVCRARKHQGRLFFDGAVKGYIRPSTAGVAGYFIVYFYRFNKKISLGIKEIKFHGLRSVSLSCGDHIARRHQVTPHDAGSNSVIHYFGTDCSGILQMLQTIQNFKSNDGTYSNVRRRIFT